MNSPLDLLSLDQHERRVSVDPEGSCPCLMRQRHVHRASNNEKRIISMLLSLVQRTANRSHRSQFGTSTTTQRSI